MANTEKTLNIRDYLEIALRRKWYIIIAFMCSIFISFGVYKYLPKVYKATTLILVQPQRVPESYVRATITDSMVNRLNTISQEILSRTRLEHVIQEFNLYSELRSKVPMEGIVEMMRKAIEIKVQKEPQNERTTNSFSISFEGGEARTVMMVTNKLTSLFIEENLKVRESQAEGTSQFISKELLGIEDRLKQTEQDIRNFKERHMGQLPQQLDANLRILERLQQQVKTTNENIKAAEDRSMLLQNMIEQLKTRELSLREQFSVQRGPRRNLSSSPEDQSGERIPENLLVTQLNNLRKDLASAQSRYKETHPDVRDLKKKIADLEPRVKELSEKQEAEREARLRARLEASQGIVTEESLPPVLPDPATERLLAQYIEQYNGVLLEVRRLREEEKGLKEQMVLYQKRIEEAPKREQELVLLSRDYDLLKTNYQSLSDKNIQAQMSENLERKQQGEQFKILDPARLPEKPIKPDRNKILLMGAVIGLVSGLGLTWFRESLDQSFHTVSDMESYLEIPVLAIIPNLKEERKAA